MLLLLIHTASIELSLLFTNCQAILVLVFCPMAVEMEPVLHIARAGGRTQTRRRCPDCCDRRCHRCCHRCCRRHCHRRCHRCCCHRRCHSAVAALLAVAVIAIVTAAIVIVIAVVTTKKL